MQEPYYVDLNKAARYVFFVCIAAEIVLLLMNIIFNYYDVLGVRNIRRIWNIARELSIPTWFSSTQTQLMGLTAIIIAVIKLRTKASWRKTWLLAGCLFVWIGIDDAAEIHEKLGPAISELLGGNGGSGTYISFAWHIYVAPVFLILGFYLAYVFWLELLPHRLYRYVFFGFGMWVVSQGIDFFEGMGIAETVYDRLTTLAGANDGYFVSHSFKVIEEMLEMVGTTLLWVGFIYYLAILAKDYRLGFRVRES